ncbi:hypothetical protein [Sandaracinus amylolyticus]|uniref:hypothetical protein n=1 Tax=Sandaracinus amylolyticus TaxID=927083 RepID=UPI001F2F1C6F|nr:hypothetical protein [Sandaracinus amylolyticus]UJR81894.1 Hypothetical protein I5071_39590 [Sandaracinus amylolyticus]
MARVLALIVLVAAPSLAHAQPRAVRDPAIADAALALEGPSGALTVDELETGLRAVLAPISACLRERPTDPADITLELEVGARGRATPRITSTLTSAQRRFARCLTRAFGAARFPERDASTRVVVHALIGTPTPSIPGSTETTSASTVPTAPPPPTSAAPSRPLTEEELHARALASVQTAMAAHPEALAACARRAAVQAHGRVWVRVTFPSASGAPAIDIVRSDIESEALTSCVAETMRGWTYESPGATANVVLPIAIARPGS